MGDDASARAGNDARFLLRGEPISDARLGEQVPRAGGIDFEFSPELCHVNPQVMGLLGVWGTPDLQEELAMRENFPRIADERGQQSVLDWREVYLLCSQ